MVLNLGENLRDYSIPFITWKKVIFVLSFSDTQ